MLRQSPITSLLEKAERIDVKALGLEEALGRLMPEVAAHFGAEFASVLALDPATHELHFIHGMGADLETLRRVRLRLGEGIAGAVALGRRPSCIADVAPVPQHSKVVDDLTGKRTHSLLAVPLIWSSEVVGVVEVGNRVDGDGTFKPDDLDQARALSGILAGWLAMGGETSVSSSAQPTDRQLQVNLPDGPLLVGTHAKIREVLDLVLRVAPTDDPVLVLGESGTGKELIARRIHHSSDRADKPLVVLNCAALSETLLESQMFGHVRGAFTDAREDHMGAFEQADGGTLFLDEIGEMSPNCQAKLLRALDNGEITPLGSGSQRMVNVRVVAATNRDLEQEVKESRFRLDLYYRLRGIEVQLPPLRERTDDIPLLMELFLRKACERKKRDVRAIGPDVISLFMRYHWPGNVRELRQAVEAMVTLTQRDTLGIGDLPPSTRRAMEEAHSLPEPLSAAASTHADSDERREIAETLARTCYPGSGRWNIARAARDLDMSRKTLEYKIKKVHRLIPPGGA